MASRNPTRTTLPERAAWLTGYGAALSGLAYRKLRPTLLGRICAEHAEVALEEYRQRFTKEPRR